MKALEIPDDKIKQWIYKASKEQPPVSDEIKKRTNGAPFQPVFDTEGGAYRRMSVRTVGQAMKEILLKHIQRDTRSSTGLFGLREFDRNAIVLNYPKYNTGMRNFRTGYTIGVDFDEAYLFRPSLMPEKYGGINNILELFVKGYTAKHAVSGLWHQKETRSLAHRPPANDTSFYPRGNFIQNAIDEFNTKFKGIATATIKDDRYK